MDSHALDNRDGPRWSRMLLNSDGELVKAAGQVSQQRSSLTSRLATHHTGGIEKVVSTEYS